MKRLAFVLALCACPLHAEEFDTVLLEVTYLTETLAWCSEQDGIPMILKARIPNIIGTTEERPKQIVERRGASSRQLNSFKMNKFSSVSPIQGVLEIGLEACQNLWGYRNKTGTWKLFDQAGTEFQSGSLNQGLVALNFRRVDRNRQTAEQTYYLDVGGQVFFKHGDVDYQQKTRFSKSIPSE